MYRLVLLLLLGILAALAAVRPDAAVATRLSANSTPVIKAPPTPTPTRVNTPTPTPVPAPQVISDWTAVSGPPGSSGSIWSFQCVDELNCWVGMQHAPFVLYRTRDGGQSWRGGGPSKNDGFDAVFSISMLSPMHGFITTIGTIVWETLDGGETWAKVMVDGDRLHDVQFATKDVGFGRAFIGNEFRFYRSVDAGRTWHSWDGKVPFPAYIGHTVFLDEEVAWRADQRSVAYTVDGWRSSYNRVGPSYGNGGQNVTFLNDVDFIDYQHGWVGGGYPNGDTTGPETGSGLIYRTTDAGQTWKQITLSPPYRMVWHVKFVNSLVGYATAGYRNATYLILTRDGGDTWTPEIVVPSSTIFGGINCLSNGYERMKQYLRLSGAL